MTDFGGLIARLVDAGVEFIIVGGGAAAAHGAARTTLDLDVVYRRTPENLSRIVTALSQLAAAPSDPSARPLELGRATSDQHCAKLQ